MIQKIYIPSNDTYYNDLSVEFDIDKNISINSKDLDRIRTQKCRNNEYLLQLEDSDNEYFYDTTNIKQSDIVKEDIAASHFDSNNILNTYVSSGVNTRMNTDHITIYSATPLSEQLYIRIVAKVKNIKHDYYNKVVLCSTNFKDSKMIKISNPFIDNSIMMAYKYEFLIPKITDLKNHESDTISEYIYNSFKRIDLDLEDLTFDLGIELYWHHTINNNKDEIARISSIEERYDVLETRTISFVDMDQLLFDINDHAMEDSQFCDNYIEITPYLFLNGEKKSFDEIQGHLYMKLILREWYVPDEYRREDGGYQVLSEDQAPIEINIDSSIYIPITYRPIIKHASCIQYSLILYAKLSTTDNDYVYGDADKEEGLCVCTNSKNPEVYGKKMGHIVTTDSPIINVYNKRFEENVNNDNISVNLTVPSHTINSDSIVEDTNGSGNVLNNPTIEQFINVTNIICTVTKMTATEVEE